MTDAEDRERLRTLIHRFLDQTLPVEELGELEALLRDHDDARRELVLASALHQELFVLHEVPARVPLDRPDHDLAAAGEGSGRRPLTHRSSRRFSSGLRQASWAPAIAAAVFLVVAALFLLRVRSDAGTPGQGRRDSARGGGGDGQLPAPGPGESSAAAQDSAVDPAREERIREEASRRLADLERRRANLERAATGEADPKRVDRQKSDLGLLQEEKRKIEEEMRSAIEQARRTHAERPAATTTAEASPRVPEHPSPVNMGPVGSVERLEGEGYLVRKDRRSPVREGAEILSGDGLETVGAPGRLVVRFGDRTRLELRGESVITEITDEDSSGIPHGKQIQMTRGMLSAEVSKQPAGRPLLLKTPHSEALVLGTSLRLLVDPGEKGATRLEVQEGRVRFTRLVDKKASVEVTGGHSAVAAPGMPLVSHPLPLPRTGTAEKPVLTGLTMLSADSGRPLVQFDPLEDGTVITLANLSTRALNIQASTSPATVGSVLFVWDGTPAMEGRAPYLLAGNDTRGKALAWTPTPGEHTLTVTPYSGPSAANKREGTGTVGTGITVRLLVR